MSRDGNGDVEGVGGIPTDGPDNAPTDDRIDDVDRYLDRACGHLKVGSSLRAHLRDEIRGHLLEAIEGHISGGLAREEAVARAIEDLGDPAEVAAGLEGVYGRHAVRLLIEKAMEWKERTMKTGWKWTFVAHAALAVILVAEVLFVLLAAVYVFPLVSFEFDSMDLETPSYMQVARNLVQWIFDWGPALLALGAAALAVFEWRYRGESKPMVRLAAGGLSAVLLMGLLWLVAISMSVPLVQLHLTWRDDWAATVVRRRAVEAEEAYRDLEQALAAERLDQVAPAAMRLSSAVRRLQRGRASLLGLLALHRDGELGALRDTLRDIEECSGTLARFRKPTLGKTEEEQRISIERAYARLTSSVEGWPQAGEEPSDSRGSGGNGDGEGHPVGPSGSP